MGRGQSATRGDHLQIFRRRGLRGTFAISTSARADPGKMVLEESKHGRSQREFAVDFLTGTGSAHISQDHKDVSKKIKIEPGRTFAGFGFSIALSNLRKRLLGGEQVPLKAVGFSQFPTPGPPGVT